jgi:DNA gyrase/topoisomerase IV subunit B
VETCDGKRQRRFLQTFSSNMSSKSEPKITACKATDNWTCITFQPDLAKFDMQVGGEASGGLRVDILFSCPRLAKKRCT